MHSAIASHRARLQNEASGKMPSPSADSRCRPEICTATPTGNGQLRSAVQFEPLPANGEALPAFLPCSSACSLGRYELERNLDDVELPWRNGPLRLRVEIAAEKSRRFRIRHRNSLARWQAPVQIHAKLH